MMYLHPTNKAAGFTLVEVLVAISILLLASVGPMNIITQSNNSSAFAAEQTQAFFFAQEGVELVRKFRDDLQLTHFENSSGLPSPFANFRSLSATFSACYAATGCGVHIGNGATPGLSVTDCSPTSNCRLRENTNLTDRSRFIHGGTGTETPFTRVITLTDVSSSQVRVESTVTWRTGSLIASQEVVVSTYLFDVYGTN